MRRDIASDACDVCRSVAAPEALTQMSSDLRSGQQFSCRRSWMDLSGCAMKGLRT